MTTGNDPVTHTPLRMPTLETLDTETRALVRLAALLAGGSEADIRIAMADAAVNIRADWVEELILQTYLFAGFPRALNAAREWRRISTRPAPRSDEGQNPDIAAWTERGEETCSIVYGSFYERLRHNIRELHPALDSWMIVEGYGKVLSRRHLDLARRELCIIAACAIARQDRQLHSHLHGALNAGAIPSVVSEALDSLHDLIPNEDHLRYHALYTRVLGK